MDDLSLRAPVLLLAATAAGLQAGTYSAWATGVLPGLARVDDRTFVHAVQQVNTAILNPVFLAGFVAAPVLAAVAVATTPGPARWWAVGGAALAVATVVVTAAGNVPLDDALARVDLDAGPSVLASAREAFEDPWSRWNVVRTLTSTGSLLCLGWAALRP